MRWHDADGESRSLLSDDEAAHLSIARGTLSQEERDIVNQHIVTTIKMLDSLPFPKFLHKVPEYASAHHEHIDGTGYPRGLTRMEMSVPARVMAIADVFEALTDGDRPYKPGMPLSRALAILGKMKLDQHIDPASIPGFPAYPNKDARINTTLDLEKRKLSRNQGT